MVLVYPFFARAINWVHLLWLALFSSHCYLINASFWQSSRGLLFVNIAFLTIGAILHVRPGSLKEWGRPSAWLYHLFSLGYVAAMILAMLSLYDLHYISV